ncbi:MAG: putative LPS assembly protein LptD, partial [Gemmatimonadota bacterium]|nr:putative LPS assembly protein LptD [Gemmatimonadota bacterium]
MNLPRSIQYSTRILLLIIVSRLFCVPDSHAQGPPDSIPAARADSSGAASEADSASLEKKLPIPKPDSLMHALEDSAKHAGGRIRYSGETITFFPSTSVVLIQGQACVEMEGRKVEADSFIAYNRNTGEIVVGGGPEMTDGKEKIEGRRFRYNIDRDRGIVEQAQTEFGDWRLKSDSLSKVGPDSIFGRGNRFTSCDRDPEPHYHFESPKIKVIRNKTVFASPVVLKIGKVPVFVLPFVFFPITTGDRVSGILQPRVGLNSVRRDKTTGRTIGNLGYFWAPNDYVDFLGAVDIRTGSQTTLRGRSRYRKRYGFEGDFDARLVKDKINNSTSYSLFGRHRQTIGERGRLIGEVNYTSTKNLLRNTSFDLQDLLRQSLRSTASYSWRPSWGSFNSSVRHEMFLDEGASRTVMNLPSVSLSLNKRSLFKYLAKTVPRRRGVVSTGWLYNITYGVSTDYSNTRTAREGNDTRTVHRS